MLKRSPVTYQHGTLVIVMRFLLDPVSSQGSLFLTQSEKHQSGSRFLVLLN